MNIIIVIALVVSLILTLLSLSFPHKSLTKLLYVNIFVMILLGIINFCFMSFLEDFFPYSVKMFFPIMILTVNGGIIIPLRKYSNLFDIWKNNQIVIIIAILCAYPMIKSAWSDVNKHHEQLIIDQTNYLQQLKKDINTKNPAGETILMVAVEKRDYHKVTQSLTLGVNVNAKDNSGKTALILACERADYSIIKELLEAGADVNEKDNYGDTALIRCVHMLQDKDTINLLLNAGADVNAQNNEGNTALMKASSVCPLETVKLLVDSGADINKKNNNGNTALAMAIGSTNVKNAQFLKSINTKI